MHEDMRDEDETTLVGSRNIYFSNNFRLDGAADEGCVASWSDDDEANEMVNAHDRETGWGPNADGTARGIETWARRRGTTYETTRSQTVGG